MEANVLYRTENPYAPNNNTVTVTLDNVPVNHPDARTIRVMVNGVPLSSTAYPITGPTMRLVLPATTESVPRLSGLLPAFRIPLSIHACNANQTPLADVDPVFTTLLSWLSPPGDAPPAGPLFAMGPRKTCDDPSSSYPQAVHRLVDGALLQPTPKDRHVWNLPFRSFEGGGSSALRQVYLRVCFEGIPEGAIVAVTWSTTHHHQSRKGRAGGDLTAWTETTGMWAESHLTAGSTESVFFFVLPRDTDGGVVCRIEPGACQEPTATMRYSVYAHLVDSAPLLPLPCAQPAAAAASAGAGMGLGAGNRQLPFSTTTGKKRAVIVGVSKYTRVRPRSDLEYCDDDACSWYQYLTRVGFECLIYGDEHSPYPKWDGPATVRNVRRAVQRMLEEAHGPEDCVAFIDSSHGNGDGRGNSHLNLLSDPFQGTTVDERMGQYWDVQLADDLSRAGTSQARTFVFLDACFSGPGGGL